jgi:hypothetical protein
MALYTIGDLHLALSMDKPMDIFGQIWKDHDKKIAASFSTLSEEDVVVLCGDFSWGMSLEQALEDFRFLDSLPGQKLLLKGNHDYWWDTVTKMNAFLEANGLRTIRFLHNNSFSYGAYALCGTRGWFKDEETADKERNRKVLNREVMRLEMSLGAAEVGKPILCFLHYPPLYQGYECPEILETLQKYPVERCYFGHLHGLGHRRAIEGERFGIDFSLVSADYLDFKLKKICE